MERRIEDNKVIQDVIFHTFCLAAPLQVDKRCRTRHVPVGCPASLICKRMKQVWQLALCVLRGLTGTFEAGLLAFLHARVSCEEASFAYSRLRNGVYAHLCTRQGVTNSAGLAACSTTNDTDGHGIRIVQVEQA